MNFLYAAYAAVWIIHGTYIAILLQRNSRLRRERELFEKSRR